MLPNFAKIDTIEFWTTVISILIITSIESLAIAKAVDKIDPYKRKANLNKDLTGIGLSTMAAGFVGGIIAIVFEARLTYIMVLKQNGQFISSYFLITLIVVLSPII